MKSHKELVQAFTAVLNHAFTANCEELSHTKSTYHTGDLPCPEEQHLQKQAEIVQEFFKDYCRQIKRASKRAVKVDIEDTEQQVVQSNNEILLEKMGIGIVK